MSFLWLQRMAEPGRGCPSQKSRSRWSRFLFKARSGGRGLRDPAVLTKAVESKAIEFSRVEMKLPHLLDVNLATQILLKELGCDEWYVACRHDHQVIVRLAKASIVTFAISFQCRPEVEKAIYHGGRAWALSIIALVPEANLSSSQIESVRAALSDPGRD